MTPWVGLQSQIHKLITKKTHFIQMPIPYLFTIDGFRIQVFCPNGQRPYVSSIIQPSSITQKWSKGLRRFLIAISVASVMVFALFHPILVSPYKLIRRSSMIFAVGISHTIHHEFCRISHAIHFNCGISSALTSQPTMNSLMHVYPNVVFPGQTSPFVPDIQFHLFSPQSNALWST